MYSVKVRVSIPCPEVEAYFVQAAEKRIADLFKKLIADSDGHCRLLNNTLLKESRASEFSQVRWKPCYMKYQTLKLCRRDNKNNPICRGRSKGWTFKILKVNEV